MRRRAFADPGRRIAVFVVEPELACRVAKPVSARPRIFGHRVQGCSSQIQSRAESLCVKYFGLKNGQDTEILRIAFEAAVVGRDLVERALAVVSIRWVADVMGQTGQFDEIEVAAQSNRHSSPDLGHFQRVRQPGARSVSLTGSHDLRLIGQTPQRCAVQYPGPIAGEVRAVLAFGTRQTRSLRRFEYPSRTVEVVVGVLLIRRHLIVHRSTVCQDGHREVRHRRRAKLTPMRIARLLGVFLTIVTAALLLAPPAGAQPPFRLQTYVTDNAGLLSDSDRATVKSAVDKLYADRHIRLWVVYVDNFSGLTAVNWAKRTISTSDLGDNDALLAVSGTGRAYAFLVPSTVRNIKPGQVDDLRRDQIEPALRKGDWAGAAVAAANGLNRAPDYTGRIVMLVVLAVIVIAVVLSVLIMRRRARRRRAAALAAARRLDPTDVDALAAVPMQALDDLSRSMVVDVDNALRTSTNELAVAIDEFGKERTQPFTDAVNSAKAALTQAFTVRQQLEDAMPETPAQRREMLTRVIVSAARADRELESQTEGFEKLRDLLINAPARLDGLTQQYVELTSRIAPAQQRMAQLRSEFEDAALSSVAGNVVHAKERLAFADRNISTARDLADHVENGQQTGLVDAFHAAESALGQALSLLDAVDTAAGDIRHAVASLPSTTADVQANIKRADERLKQTPKSRSARIKDLSAARDAAVTAADGARSSGSADPLGAFAKLTRAGADLTRALTTLAEEQATAERLNHSYEQALFTAESRVQAVSEYIDTRRGSIGPEARTRLAEAKRQLQVAHDKRTTNLLEATAYANGASAWAAYAQSLANADVQSAERAYSRQRGASGASDTGALIGGIIISDLLRGGTRGGLGGGWTPTSFGGSSNSSGGGFMGGGGRF